MPGLNNPGLLVPDNRSHSARHSTRDGIRTRTPQRTLPPQGSTSTISSLSHNAGFTRPTAMYPPGCASGQRLELQFTVPKTAVLPLDDPEIRRKSPDSAVLGYSLVVLYDFPRCCAWIRTKNFLDQSEGPCQFGHTALVLRMGFEPTASGILKPRGLPVAYPSTVLPDCTDQSSRG